jgi:acetoin utilization deacetylase AcuC-like enzyme
VRPLILRHDASLHHDTGQHPERIARMEAIERELEARAWLGYAVRDSAPAGPALIDAVHAPGHREAIAAACAAGGGALDADTIVSPGSFAAALHAAGGAAAVVDALLAGTAPVAASLHRPPGHHAEAGRAMGFCLFNSVAVAARHAIDEHGLQRVLILDWDVHHGNGTNDIFHADPRVLFVSIHQAPLYPGSGAASDRGSGAGEGFTLNLPVPAGSGDAVYRALVDHVVVPAARAYEPQLVLVSAGFDAHAADPLAGCTVTEAGFAAMAASVRRLAADMQAPVGLVLEGGYDLAALAGSLAATLETLARDPGDLAAEPAPAHPLADAAAARLAAR